AVAAADVDDRLVAVPLDGGEPCCAALLPLLHRVVEDRALARMLGEPRPEVGAELAPESVLAARVEGACGAEENASEELREGAVGAAAELRRGRVREDTRLRLGEHPVARERAEDAMERVGVDAGSRGEVGDRAGPGRERLGDADVGGDRGGARRQAAAQEVP